MVVILITYTSLVYLINCENYFAPHWTSDTNFYDGFETLSDPLLPLRKSKTSWKMAYQKSTIKAKIYISHQMTRYQHSCIDIMGNRTFFALALDCNFAPNNLLTGDSKSFTCTPCQFSNFNSTLVERIEFLSDQIRY